MRRLRAHQALSTAVAIVIGHNQLAMCQPPSNNPSKPASLPCTERMKAALVTAKTKLDLKNLNSLMEGETFGTEALSNASTRLALTELVGQTLKLVKSLKPTDESVRCQALIARYYATIGDNEQAIANYNAAIADSENSWKPIHEQTLEASILEDGCHKALTLLYTKEGKLAQAEKHYARVNWPWQNLSGAEKEKMFRTNMSHAANRTGQAVLASRLGEAYERKGQNNEALKKFADMLAFETFALDPGFRNPYSSNSPIIKWHQEPATPTSSMHPDFDPLVGKYPPLREIVEPYIKFGRKNPSLVKAEALSRVQQQLDTLQALSRSHAAMERNFDWRVKEQGLLGTLRADPAKGLAMLKEEIAERKKADSKDPSLADSITLIGYQLVQVGLYSDAEEFIREAIALREKQGAPASHALGHCLSNLGVLYLEEGKLEQSKPLLEKALKMREGDPADEFAKAKTQIAYGRLLAAQGNLKEAEEQLKAAVGRLQQNSAVPEKLSAREFNLTRTPIPVIMELRAMKMQEHYVASFFYPLALIELGSLYRQEGKHDIARATINQAKACPSAESRGSGRQVSMIS